MDGNGGLLALIKLRRSTQVRLLFMVVAGLGLPGRDLFASSNSEVYSDGLGGLGEGQGEGARHLVGGPSCFPLSTLSIVRIREGRVDKLGSASFGIGECEALSEIGSAVAT